jgi:hypothetical protein
MRTTRPVADYTLNTQSSKDCGAMANGRDLDLI